MDDEERLLCEWQAAREAYDEALVSLFPTGAGGSGGRPDPLLLREAAHRRAVEELARRRYYASRGLDGA
ncbi:hypothetical protein [Intrasporangium flavum]|uniref:hypothetical protein n=1 Tax=Intrasporangium flavum TaxID=1428657 RepID=UPI00096C2417|nr:hypothetical protein [Intrasporangium flavum]